MTVYIKPEINYKKPIVLDDFYFFDRPYSALEKKKLFFVPTVYRIDLVKPMSIYYSTTNKESSNGKDIPWIWILNFYQYYFSKHSDKSGFN